MDKVEREKLYRAGITILRPQWVEHKSCWKIVRYTRVPAWCRFGLMWFGSKELCDGWITSLVKASKGKIKADE